MSKKNEDKYKPSLVYTSCIEKMAKVREYGIDKYGHAEEWTTTNDAQMLDAAIRHIRAAMDGDLIDESGHLHYAMAMTNLMFIIERFHRTQIDSKKNVGH